MAVGEIINGVNPSDGAGTYTFQPAATVTIIITFATPTYSGGDVQMFNGTQRAGMTTEADSYAMFNIKMGIDNTNYLRIYNANTDANNSSAYSGIQLT